MLESGSALEISDEDGNIFCTATAFSPVGVTSGDRASFLESLDFCNTLSTESMDTVMVTQTTDTEDLFLIEIPDMDSEQSEKAHGEILKKMKEFPDYGVMLHGSGAKSAQSKWSWADDLLRFPFHFFYMGLM